MCITGDLHTWFTSSKRRLLCLEKRKGGLGAIDMGDLQISFVIKWFQKLLCEQESDQRWTNIPTHELNKLGPQLSILKTKISATNCINLEVVKSTFWKKAVQIWLKHSDNCEQEDCNYLWNNMNVTLQGKPLFIERWISKGFKTVEDVMLNGEIMPYDILCERLGRSGVTNLEYLKVKAAVNSYIGKNMPTQVPDKKVTFKGKDISKLSTREVTQKIVRSLEKCLS